VSDDETQLLLGCFGPDLCYGASWTLLHRIETAPGALDLQVETLADGLIPRVRATQLPWVMVTSRRALVA
jgi:hypothetical protein